MTKRSHPRPGRTGSGRGSRTSTKIGTSSCKSRAISNARNAQAEAGHHRCHGESCADQEPRAVKSMLEPSVKNGNLVSDEDAARARLPQCQQLGVSDADTLPSDSELESSQRRQGHSRPPKAPRVIMSNAGTSIRAPGCESGKLPSPATSRTRGGASVVVGARESRAHGEGRQ
jgi:hypothetical protein